MSKLQWVLAVVGMFSGLGIARNLSSFAAVIRSRGVSRPDWVSLLWAGTIFFTQLDLWWMLHNMMTAVERWTFPVFLMLLIQPLLLFFATVMVLPSTELKSGEDYRELYDRDGHWALLAISAFYFEMLIESLFYWNFAVTVWGVIFAVTMAVLPMVAFFSPRRIHGVIALIYFVANVFLIFVDPYAAGFVQKMS